jgi:indolepyruvate ferredoxin oxidoreductase, beta subunit
MKNDNINNRKQEKTESSAYLERNRKTIDDGSTLSVMFSGVGGQGIILASTVLARAATVQGYDVKVSEVHGMAQRGGSVVGSVRFGKKVYSPIIDKADIIMALEKLEAVRYLDLLKPDGFLFINDHELVPVSVHIGDKKYPPDITEIIREVTSAFSLVKASEEAAELGEARAGNIVLIGSLSRFLPIKLKSWEKALEELLPEPVLELNLNAFARGREIIK